MSARAFGNCRHKALRAEGSDAHRRGLPRAFDSHARAKTALINVVAKPAIIAAFPGDRY